MVQLLREVRDRRQARFAFVRGEPGIGKTRLIEAVTALASGAGEPILSASAYESESIRPFALWMDALHRYDAAACAAEIFGDRESGQSRSPVRQAQRLYCHEVRGQAAGPGIR